MTHTVLVIQYRCVREDDFTLFDDSIPLMCMTKDYPLSEMEEVLDETYGLLLYPEQLMRLAHTIAFLYKVTQRLAKFVIHSLHIYIILTYSN